MKKSKPPLINAILNPISLRAEINSPDPSVNLMLPAKEFKSSTPTPLRQRTLSLNDWVKSISPRIPRSVISPTSWPMPQNRAISSMISASTMVESISKTIIFFRFLYILSGWAMISIPISLAASKSLFLSEGEISLSDIHEHLHGQEFPPCDHLNFLNIG